MTEFSFILPQGLTRNFSEASSKTSKVVYRQGTMRLATARDEIEVQNDSRVKQNPAYSVLVYFSLVITKLGDLSRVTPQILENLSVLDLAYLREFYNRINQRQASQIAVKCPHCQQKLEVELALAGK